MDAVLLEEFTRDTVPPSVRNLLKCLNVEVKEPTKNDFLALCIYILMVEYGFMPLDIMDVVDDIGFNIRNLRLATQILPKKWRDTDGYTFSFSLSSFPLLVANVLIAPMGDDLLVNVYVKNMENCGFSILIDVLTYYTHADAQVNYAEIQCLKQLALLFKEKIAFPLKMEMLKWCGLPAVCFEDLPKELIMKVCEFIDVKNLLSLACVNSHFNALIKDSFLWKLLLKRDFGIKQAIGTFEDVKKLYVEKHLQKVKRPTTSNLQRYLFFSSR